MSELFFDVVETSSPGLTTLNFTSPRDFFEEKCFFSEKNQLCCPFGDKLRLFNEVLWSSLSELHSIWPGKHLEITSLVEKIKQFQYFGFWSNVSQLFLKVFRLGSRNSILCVQRNTFRIKHASQKIRLFLKFWNSSEIF